ncbi:MAG: VWA domain-containing protein, partial [Oscillochloris sp.]|nr:VWA domain-containing protein [Oscillochloris sp.]
DGVSNEFLNPSNSDLDGGWSYDATYASGSYCRNQGSKVIENAGCQTTDVGGKYNGMDRPITQMINTSQQNLRNATTNAEVFVLSLSNIPETGLKSGVASSENYYYPIPTLTTNATTGKTNVDEIIEAINTKVETGACIAGANGTSTNVITSAEFVNGTLGFQYPQVGKVTITNSSNTLSTPIIAATDGTLSYHFEKVPQGTYRMEAYIVYHHPSDPAGVMRTYSKIWTAGEALNDFTVDVSPSTQGTSFIQRIEQPLILKLNGNVCP